MHILLNPLLPLQTSSIWLAISKSHVMHLTFWICHIRMKYMLEAMYFPVKLHVFSFTQLMLTGCLFCSRHHVWGTQNSQHPYFQGAYILEQENG